MFTFETDSLCISLWKVDLFLQVRVMATKIDDKANAMGAYFLRRLREEEQLALTSHGSEREAHVRACAIIRELIGHHR